METSMFEQKVMRELRHQLRVRNLSLERARIIARKALALSQQCPKKVPVVKVKRFFAVCPEINQGS